MRNMLDPLIDAGLAHCGYETEKDTDAPMAADMVNSLSTAYPGHDWFVLIRGGIVQVKLMDINPVWGMVIPYNKVKGDALARKKDVIRAGGEFLERANLKRGAKEYREVLHVEGIPDKDLR
jgi:hypothetical protein